MALDNGNPMPTVLTLLRVDQGRYVTSNRLRQMQYHLICRKDRFPHHPSVAAMGAAGCIFTGRRSRGDQAHRRLQCPKRHPQRLYLQKRVLGDVELLGIMTSETFFVQSRILFCNVALTCLSFSPNDKIKCAWVRAHQVRSRPFRCCFKFVQCYITKQKSLMLPATLTARDRKPHHCRVKRGIHLLICCSMSLF